MPRFSPFPALRYASDADLQTVLAPPYDVLTDADVDELAGVDRNIVRIDVPRGDYAGARRTLDAWVDAGVLVPDAEPSFTIYRMSFTDVTGCPRLISGVLGGLEVVDEHAGGVLAHERTTPKAKTDRLDLTRATALNTSPVWGLSLARGLSDELASPGEPLGEVVADGVRHSFERVSDPQRISRIARIVGSDDVLIADGHHRYAISRTYRDEVRAASGRRDTLAEETLTFVSELVADQLAVQAIHRLYPGVEFGVLREALATRFDLEPAPEPSPELLADMTALGRLVLVGPASTEWLIARPGAFDGVRALDGAWLEATLEATGIEPEYNAYLDEITDALASGAAGGAVLIRPTSLDEIMRTAREGLLMPPKSTFFTPKPRTGVTLRATEPLPN